MPYYLSAFVGAGTKANPFVPSVRQPGYSHIDLRPDGGATLGGGGLNACLLFLPVASLDPSLTLIGLDPADLLGAVTVSAINAKLGTTASPGRLDQVVSSLLLAPPVNGWKPLLAGVDHPPEIWLNGIFWRQAVSGSSDPAWLRLKHWHRLTPTQRYLYDVWSHAGASPWLAFRLARREQWPIAGGVLPATDNFNRANEAPLSNGGKWTVFTALAGAGQAAVVANQCQDSGGGNGDGGAFWNADAFNGDHYGQVVVASFTVNGCGPACRGQGANPNESLYFWDHTAADTNTIWKYVNDVQTSLLVTNATFALNDTAKIDASGSTIRVYRNGTQTNSTTDTSITGGASALKVTDGAVDNWQGDNLAAAGSKVSPRLLALLGVGA